MFGSEFFSGNREHLRRLFTGTAPIVLVANGLLQRTGDEAYAFTQDPNFWYVTGLDIPNACLVMDKEKTYLILPELSSRRILFEGGYELEDIARKSGITNIYDEQEGWRILSKRIKKAKHIATLPPLPDYFDQYGMYTNPARRELLRRIRQENATIELLDISQHLMHMRVIKQPLELEAIQRAIEITIASLKETIRPSKRLKYAYEYEIEAELSKSFRKRNVSYGFSPVIASGRRACTIHNIANNGQLASDELLLIDVGAEYDHYISDITRTYALGDGISRRAQSIYDAVIEARAHALELLQPGVMLGTYEQQMQAFLGEKLRELNLIKVIEPENVRNYAPHRTSHFLGLQAHDVGDYELPLEPGMVLTVEPGIYVREEAIGVRVEDDIVITADGPKVMTDALPLLLC